VYDLLGMSFSCCIPYGFAYAMLFVFICCSKIHGCRVIVRILYDIDFVNYSVGFRVVKMQH
jgi:hypothetical protein